MDQWEQLWEDIRSKAESRISKAENPLSGGTNQAPHFLGAVVLDPQPRQGLIGVDTFHIIDGQQRLTTLQYILKSALISLKSVAQAGLTEIVTAVLFNSNTSTMLNVDIEQYKVWPTFRDREDYKWALSAEDTFELKEKFPDSFTQRGELRKIGIRHPSALEAIWYFSTQFNDWVNEGQDNEKFIRAEILTTTILQDLKVVSITLDEADDAQVIFETLNGRGAKLHATDLIRNFVFMRADKEGENSKDLYEKYWKKFETDYWSQSQRRGRISKPRIEWFIHCVMQTELCDEIEVGRLYFEYRRYAIGGENKKTANSQLAALTKYSDLYCELIDGDSASPIARFGRRVAPYEVTTLHPLALLIASSDLSVDDENEMFDLLVSYVVRRAVCDLTAKNYNNIFLSVLRELSKGEVSPQSLCNILGLFEHTGSRWPRNGEFRQQCEKAQLYPGRMDARKMRAFLEEIETELQNERNPEIELNFNEKRLDIDHILPKSWFSHWPLPLENDEFVQSNEMLDLSFSILMGIELTERQNVIERRESSKFTLGNLTLLDLSVNRQAQNRSFQEKRDLLIRHTNLRLNIPLLVLNNWDEDQISHRSSQLADVALRVWSGIDHN